MLVVLNHKNGLNLLNVKKYEKILRDLDVIVMPQLPYLNLFNNGMYKLGTQSLYINDITGSISSKTLKAMNVDYALIGHNDQRKYLNESEAVISKKIDEAINNDITPIVCLGESNEEKKLNKGIYIVEKEINKILSGVKGSINDIIIAYEPKWNIENIDKDLEYIDKMLFFIKSYISDNYGFSLKVLYDGDINSKNIKTFLKLKVVDGFILEDSSVDIYEVINIYETING